VLNNSTQYWKGAINSVGNTFCGCSRTELPVEENFKEESGSIPIYVEDPININDKKALGVLKGKETSSCKFKLI
jgi:hypothetical protein